MIKPGQIYESKLMEKIKIVITQKSLAGFGMLFQDGSMQKKKGLMNFILNQDGNL